MANQHIEISFVPTGRNDRPATDRGTSREYQLHHIAALHRRLLGYLRNDADFGGGYAGQRPPKPWRQHGLNNDDAQPPRHRARAAGTSRRQGRWAEQADPHQPGCAN